MALKLPSLFFEINADTKGLDKAQEKVKRNSEAMTNSMKGLGSAIGAAFSIELARRIIMMADSMRVMEGRIKRLTKSTKDFNTAWGAINKSADAAGIAITDAAATFERFLNATQGMNKSIDDVAKFNDLILKTGRISGASTVELNNALTQLSQGLQGGIIRAEEWNSIMEQAPEILRVASRNIEGINGDMGKLRAAMLEGKLEAETFFDAFMNGANEIEKEFAKVPKSIEQNLQAVTNQSVRLISNLDKTYNLTKNLANNVKDLADLFDENERKQAAMADAQEKRNERMIELYSQIREAEDALEANRAANDAVNADRNERRIKAMRAELDAIKQIEQAERDRIKVAEMLSSALAEGFVPLGGEAQKSESKMGVLGEGTKKGKKTKTAKRKEISEDSGRDFLASIFALGNDAYEEIARIQLQQIEEANALRAQNLISEQEYQDALTAISANAAQERADLEKSEMEATARMNQEQVQSISDMAASIGSIMGNLASNNDSTMGKIASGFNAFATTIIATSQAMAAAQALSDPTALTLPQKLANYATILSSFASITSMLAGGRVHGGSVMAGAMHPVGEGNEPELLQQGGKQYLIPGENGKVVSNKDAFGDGGQSISNNMSVSVNMTATGDAANDQRAAERAAMMAVDEIVNQLNSKNGKFNKAMVNNYGQGRTSGRLL